MSVRVSAIDMRHALIICRIRDAMVSIKSGFDHIRTHLHGESIQRRGSNIRGFCKLPSPMLLLKLSQRDQGPGGLSCYGKSACATQVFEIFRSSGCDAGRASACSLRTTSAWRVRSESPAASAFVGPACRYLPRQGVLPPSPLCEPVLHGGVELEPSHRCSLLPKCVSLVFHGPQSCFRLLASCLNPVSERICLTLKNMRSVFASRMRCSIPSACVVNCRASDSRREPSSH